jgi:hypothetical protein
VRNCIRTNKIESATPAYQKQNNVPPLLLEKPEFKPEKERVDTIPYISKDSFNHIE